MPRRDTRDRSRPGAYHVFNRAARGARLFRDDADREVFLDLLVRHLARVTPVDPRGRPYRCLRDQVRLNAHNLMVTHFHLILWQRVPGGMDQLMRRVIGGYVRYYNDRHGTSGALLEGPYRAKLIETRASYRWRIAYVHDNHKRLGPGYRFSSHRFFERPADAPGWLDVGPALRVFGGSGAYRDYMEKRGVRRELDLELRVGRS